MEIFPKVISRDNHSKLINNLTNNKASKKQCKMNSLKNSLKKEILNYINLENKINIFLPINKNFRDIITNQKSYLKFKENYKNILEEINLNRSSIEEIKEILEIYDESIFLDFVKYILFNKYKNSSRATLQGNNLFIINESI